MHALRRHTCIEHNFAPVKVKTAVCVAFDADDRVLFMKVLGYNRPALSSDPLHCCMLVTLRLLCPANQVQIL